MVEGRARNGGPCRVVDSTGTVDRGLLEELLADPVQARRLDLSGMSASGTEAIRLGAPDFTHIQLGGELNRLILFPCETRLEAL